MQSSIRHVHRSTFTVGLFLFTLILTACGSFTESPASTPTPSPRSSPPLQSTPSPAGQSGFALFTGDGYTIDYPVGWKASGSKDNVTIQDPTTIYNFAIEVTANPEGIASASTVVNLSINAAKSKFKNPQNENVPATVTVGGESWAQKSASGTTTEQGQSVDVQLYILADNHPASTPATKSFVIVYTTAKQLMPVAISTYFHQMLQSFKFTS